MDNDEDRMKEAELVYLRGLAGLPADGGKDVRPADSGKSGQSDITDYVGKDIGRVQDAIRKRKTMPPSQMFLEVSEDVVE